MLQNGYASPLLWDVEKDELQQTSERLTNFADNLGSTEQPATI